MSYKKPNNLPLPEWEWQMTTLDEARKFDGLIRTLIPYYSQMVEALVSAVPLDDTASIRVLDLGCGTGTVAKTILEAFPKARVTCLDLAESMIEIAKTKLSCHPHVSYDSRALGFSWTPNCDENE